MFDKLHKALAARMRGDPAARLAAIERSLQEGWSELAFAELRALALEGSAAAQHRLGQMYESGEGVVQSLIDAAHWYELAGNQGHLASQVRLGLIYFIEPPAPASLTTAATDPVAGAEVPLGALSHFFPAGVSVRQDFTKAFEWNRRAAEQGSAEAQSRLGQQLVLGLGTDRNVVEAERWFAAAAEQGNAGGQVALGLLFAGSYGTVPDYARAAHWFARAAQAGNPVAHFGLGKLLWHGEGIATDADAAMQHFKEAAEHQYAPAMHVLGMVFWRGGQKFVDLAAAETWLRRAVRGGHQEAACALAQMLLERPDDDGVEAAGLLRQAAEAGNKRAAAVLAELHIFGRGVPRDAEEAARWLEVAEAESRPEAFTLLASLHAEGLGVDEDFVKAAAWLHRAAGRGNVDALYNLGSLYRLGKGVDLDPDEATRWYAEAAERGHVDASLQLSLLYGEEAAAEGRGPELRRLMAMLGRAATAGDARAQWAIGRLLATGILGPPNPAAARRWMQRAAHANFADAQAWMGDCSRLGLVGPPDLSSAEAWYRRAAAQGHPGAITLLASAAESSGQLSTDDEAEVFGLWLAAASAGDAIAQYRTGRCYLQGYGCEADASLAARWFAAAAEQGNAEAEYQLGVCYMRGLGVERDPETAARWLRRFYARPRVADGIDPAVPA